MVSFRPDDAWYDRREALGQTLEADGESVTEGFYPEFTLEPESGLRAELRVLDRLLDEIVAAA